MAKIKVQLVKSPIGCSKDQRATVKALGLKKLNSIAEHEDNACIRGMINKVSHLVKVLEA
ncbi:MAG: 50S ribosomal protein L30 [Christensenellaceae bacterium]|nr:50S ribosomal protein L30 [Christensenellaceae bacterium]